MNDDRGHLAADLFALVATVLMAYGAFWLAFKLFYPPDESILADGVAVVRGAFIDALGPTHGAWAFLAVVAALAVLLNVVVFTDLIGPDMTVEE